MKYPSNAAPRSGQAGGSQSPRPAPATPPTPANDNTPKPPPAANDNVRRRSAYSALRRYSRFLRSPIIQSAMAALLYPAFMGTRISLDSYQPAVVCSAGGTTLNVAGNCGGFIVNVPWPVTPATGRPINVSIWSIIAFRPNGLQLDIVHNARYQRVSNEVWRRPVNQWPVSPLPAPEYDYPPVPALEPHKVPVAAPAPVPAPVPFRAIPRIPPNPFAPGGTGRSGGYRPPSRSAIPGGWPSDPPSAPGDPDPAPRPTEVPAQVIDWVPGVTPRMRTGSHSLRPPKKGEKERKLQASWQGYALKLLNAVTETGDVIDAFYDALPVAFKIRRKYVRTNKWGSYAKDFVPRPGQRGRQFTDQQGITWYLDPLTHADKAKQLYRYWDKLPPEYFAEAFENLRQNEVEDRLFGTASQRLNRSLSNSRKRGYGASRGLQWGLAL